MRWLHCWTLGIRPSQEDIDRFLPRRLSVVSSGQGTSDVVRCRDPAQSFVHGRGTGGVDSPTRFFLAYGAQDRTIPLPDQQTAHQVLERAGHLTYREYSGMAHAICDEEIADIRDFLRAYDAGIASIWNISVQRGTGPSRSGSTMAECVGHAHSSRDGSAISSIPLPADAALMTGGLEWRGAVPSPSAPADFVLVLDRPRSPAAGWVSERRPVPVMSVCRLPSCARFPPAPSASSISMPLARKHAPPLIHRAPHTSHSGFHVYCMS